MKQNRLIFGHSWQRKYVPLLFCIPAVIIYTLFWVVPGISNIFISITDWRAVSSLEQARFVGLSNYIELIQAPLFWNAVANNLKYAVITVILVTIIALTMAVIVERMIRWGKGLFRGFFFLPLVLPWVVVAILWTWLYNPIFGLINNTLSAIGLQSLTQRWLGDPNIALYSVIAVAIWKSVGFFMIILMAGLQDSPLELEEAARVDGANEWQILTRIVIPIIRPIIAVVTTLLTIDAFRVFEPIYIMTQGGPGYYSTDVLSSFIYRTAFLDLRQGYASTIAIALLIIVAIISVVQFSITNKEPE